jgi:hypothetical protein
MIPINRNPTRGQLRWFAALVFPLFWGWIAFLVDRRLEWSRVAIAIATAAVLISIAGLVSPAFMRRVWIAMMVALSPIGWVMSHVILGIIYYLVLTPIGLALRAMGRDPLQRRFEPAARTYWIDRGEEPSVERYFRQY